MLHFIKNCTLLEHCFLVYTLHDGRVDACVWLTVCGVSDEKQSRGYSLQVGRSIVLLNRPPGCETRWQPGSQCPEVWSSRSSPLFAHTEQTHRSENITNCTPAVFYFILFFCVRQRNRRKCGWMQNWTLLGTCLLVWTKSYFVQNKHNFHVRPPNPLPRPSHSLLPFWPSAFLKPVEPVRKDKEKVERETN